MRLRTPASAVPHPTTSPRRRWALTAATVCVGLTVAACGGSDTSTSATTTTSAESDDPGGPGGGNLGGSNPGTSAVQDGAVVGAGQANTAEVAAAAQAFLATLTDEQRETVLYDFDDQAKTTGWSNFPTNLVERNGLALEDLDEEQQAAALAVMEAALSEQGYARLEAIRAADAYLAANQSDSGGGGGPAGGLSFGEDLYSISFFGEPVETGEFMLQFGGHHLAYNLTYAGEDVSLSPSLTAVEPTTFEWEGQSYDPLADEKASAVGAIAALTEDQLAAAEISDSYDDLLLGPQNDGPFPEPQGVLVSELGQEAQDQVTAMLRAWVGDVDEEAAEALIAQYVSEYDQTYLGWSEATELDDETTYIRLDGPSAWIEFSNQAGIEVEGVHQHTVFRSQTADYGG